MASTGAWAGLFSGLGQGLQAYAAMRMAREQRRESQERDDRDFKMRKAQHDAAMELADLQREQTRLALEAARDARTAPKRQEPPVRGTEAWYEMLDREGEIEARHRPPPAGGTRSAADREAAERMAALNTDIDNRRSQLNSPSMRLPERSTVEEPLTGVRRPARSGDPGWNEQAFLSDSTRIAGQRASVEAALRRRTDQYSQLTDDLLGVESDPPGMVRSGPTGSAELDALYKQIDDAFAAGPDTPERRQKAAMKKAEAHRSLSQRGRR